MNSPRQNEMEVDDTAVAANRSVMASSGTVGSVSISLHPLVIMNISEHWTRLRAQEGSPQQGNFPLWIVLQIKYDVYHLLHQVYVTCSTALAYVK
jgi:hypothetical protein